VNNKMNDFVGNILQNKFYACCYILVSGTCPIRRYTPICGAAMLLRCNWCRNLAAVCNGAQRLLSHPCLMASSCVHPVTSFLMCAAL